MDNNQIRKKFNDYRQKIRLKLFIKYGIISSIILAIAYFSLFSAMFSDDELPASVTIFSCFAVLQFFAMLFYNNIKSTKIAEKEFGHHPKLSEQEKNQVFTAISIIIIIVVGIIIAVIVESNSGSSWSDLSDIERENAIWAGQAYEAIYGD